MDHFYYSVKLVSPVVESVIDIPFGFGQNKVSNLFQFEVNHAVSFLFVFCGGTLVHRACVEFSHS